MIQISGLRLPVGAEVSLLEREAARLLGVVPSSFQMKLLRESLDARKKSDIHFVCTVGITLPDEGAVLRRVSRPNVTVAPDAAYRFPTPAGRPVLPPVVVGMGPAGLFSALLLARAGLRPIILERGQRVEQRVEDVAGFWGGGTLNPSSNVQFGEGGAGTFSDGKLTTGIHDPRVAAVLSTFVEMGAPPDILYKQKPHIGTDLLRVVVRQFREVLLTLGCDIRFGHTLTGLEVRDGRLAGLTAECAEGRYSLGTGHLILAPGHSARDTFHMLAEAGVPMEPKPFAVGVRIQHSQEAISRAQYGALWSRLPPADYKLACHLPGGRSVFSFCVCPGGEIINASSQPGCLVVNGMSRRARDGKFINGGLLVGVTPGDFGSSGPLSGIGFQTHWEEAAFRAGGGSFRPPEAHVGDFLAGRGVLDGCLPSFVSESLRVALPVLNRKLAGFAAPDSLLVGVETRSSSSVRLPRGSDFQSSVRGLYPCGEGAGWAGGITSAAADGLRVAEAVVASL